MSNLTNDILIGMNEGEHTGSDFIDFSKVFEKVNHCTDKNNRKSTNKRKGTRLGKDIPMR